MEEETVEEEEEQEEVVFVVVEEEEVVVVVLFAEVADGVNLASEVLLPCDRIESMLPEGEGVDLDEGVEMFRFGRTGEGV